MLFVEKAALIISEGSAPELPQAEWNGDCKLLGWDLKESLPRMVKHTRSFESVLELWKHKDVLFIKIWDGF